MTRRNRSAFRRFFFDPLKVVLGLPLRGVVRRLNLLERYSHGGRATYMGHNRVLVRAVVGGRDIGYFVEADDRLLAPWFIITGKYETALTNYFLNEIEQNSHCIDVGSNFGYFAGLFSRFAPEGKVFAVEAEARIAALCRDNLAINGFDFVGHVYHAAANDTGEPVTLFRRTGRSGNTSIIAFDQDFTDVMGEPPVEQFSVPGLKLDNLLPQLDGRVDLMKIDVEGAEPLVLRGARRIIETNPQLRIVMEWSPGQIETAGFNLKDFLEEITGWGLGIYDISKGRPRRMTVEQLLASEYMAGILLRR